MDELVDGVRVLCVCVVCFFFFFFFGGGGFFKIYQPGAVSAI